MENNKTVSFLISYLDAIGMDRADYQFTATQDSLGYLIALNIKKENTSIGILIGKKGRNLRTLKQLLRIVGFSEKILPFLIIKLI